VSPGEVSPNVKSFFGTMLGRRIVVPIDGSRASASALAHALYMLSANEEDRLMLLYVDHPDIANEKSLVPITENDALALISKYQKKRNVEVSWEKRTVDAEDARPVICSIAKEWQADYIVMGARGMGSLPPSALSLGSVAQYVSTYAHCSVLLARKKPNE